MIENLPIPTKEGSRDYRSELDESLRIGDWATPGRVVSYQRRESGAPSWWTNDEEASQSFLQSMGIVLE